MRALRNQKLVRKEDKLYAVNIGVDFERDRHLSEASIKRRQLVRDRCIAKELAKVEEERKLKEAEAERVALEKFVFLFCQGAGRCFSERAISDGCFSWALSYSCL